MHELALRGETKRQHVKTQNIYAANTQVGTRDDRAIKKFEGCFCPLTTAVTMLGLVPVSAYRERESLVGRSRRSAPFNINYYKGGAQ